MRGLVGHNIVRETTKHGLPTNPAEVAKDQGLIVLRIEGIGISKCVWRHMYLVSRETPTDSAAKGKLEPRQGFHDDGVNILMMKARIF
jgi:hypothetical protein